MIDAPEVIDDLRHASPLAVTGNGWALTSDRVMGGMSAGTMRREVVVGRDAIRMQGRVSLENDGGFLQVAIDLGNDAGEVDAPNWTGVQLDVFGNDQTYNLHLRTSDAPGNLIAKALPPHQAGRPLNSPSRILCRIGLSDR
jgi:hypothetical protein